MKQLTIEEFIQLSGISAFGITEEDIQGRCRKQKIAIARQMYWYLLNCQGIGHRRIARLVPRCKQTISSGIRTIRNLVETNDILIRPYRELLTMLHLTNFPDTPP